MKMQFAFAGSLALTVLACEDPGKDAPAAKVEEPAVPKAQKPQGGEVQTIAFDQDTAKVQFTGSKVTGSHTGSFDKLSGKVTLVGGKAEGGSIQVTIDTRSVDVEPEKLENHLRSSDFFDVEKFPEAKFESTKVERAASDDGATHTITGNLDLHGVSKQIQIPAKVEISDAAVKAQSKFSINRNDFGIVYKGMPDDLIRDLVVLELDVNIPRNRS